MWVFVSNMVTLSAEIYDLVSKQPSFWLAGSKTELICLSGFILRAPEENLGRLLRFATQ